MNEKISVNLPSVIFLQELDTTGIKKNIVPFSISMFVAFGQTKKKNC